MSTPAPPEKKPPPAPPPKKRRLSDKARRRIKRTLVGLAIALPVTLGILWYAANHVPWFGAWMADTLRSVIGTEGVADLEEMAYGVEDRWNRFWREGEKPKAYWQSPSGTNTASAPAGSAGAGSAGAAPGTAASAPSATGAPGAPPPEEKRHFRPTEIGPYNSKYAAPGDGIWVPVPIEGFPEQDALFFKTLIHPDAKRPWAEVFVVAIDLRRAKVHSVAGTAEPKGTAPGARELKRTGLIPAEDMPSLVAGWNGGFKEEHGHYGMKIGGVLLVRPRIDGCTVAMQRTGELRILPWKEAKDIEDTFEWWRQTPACLLAGGKLHPGLYDENTNWGAALGGSTVVRRSAIGLDKTGETLFVAVSNHTSPRAIGVAMQHIGAVDAAQLDINYSYPRFVLFPRNEAGQRESVSLFEGFKVEKDDYVREPNLRDFFYLTAPSSL